MGAEGSTWFANHQWRRRPLCGETAVSDPWRASFFDLQQQVDELFDELVSRHRCGPGRMSWRPPLDLSETQDAYLVALDIPDVTPENVQILVNERNLTVAGERPAAPEGATCLRSERGLGPFQRSLDLAEPIDVEKVRAEYRHGTYRLRLPKKRVSENLEQGPTVRQAESHCVVRVDVR